MVKKKVPKIYKVKITNRRTGKTETRYRVGSKKRKFSPLYTSKTSAKKGRKLWG